MVGTEFFDRLNYYAKAWLPARDLVIAGLEKRKQIDPNGRIILFEQFAPWKVRPTLRCVTTRNLTNGRRSTCSSSRLRSMSRRPKSRFTSSTRTRLAATGAFKPFPSPRRASRAGRRSLSSGVACAMMICRSSLGWMVASSCTPAVSSEVRCLQHGIVTTYPLTCVIIGNKSKEGVLQLAQLALDM